MVLRNECETGEANCGENAVCTDMEEGFNCDCGEGYEGDGFTCCGMNTIVTQFQNESHTCVQPSQLMINRTSG